MSLRSDETAALGLPLKMAVLTVVGVAGLAALLSALPSCTVPAPLAAEVVSVNGRPGDTLDSPGPVRVAVRVTARGTPVAGATAVLSGLGAANASLTNASGTALLVLGAGPAPDPSGPGNYMKLSASAPGCYQRFENEFALQVRFQ